MTINIGSDAADSCSCNTKHIEEIKKVLEGNFSPKKKDNLLLADAYSISGLEYGTAKAVRLATCARWIEFAIPPVSTDRARIVKTSSCHVRLCPVCQWRRSLNTYRNLAKVYSDAEMKGLKHLFVTLTIRNVAAADLRQTLESLSAAYSKMMRRKKFRTIIEGYARTIEVTKGKDGTFHPHIHAIWTVAPNYGHRQYISQAQLCEEWAAALQLDYIPICHIEKIKALDGKAVAEVAKYSVKPSDYLGNSIRATADIIEEIDPALDGRRFISLGGKVREVKRKIFGGEELEDLEQEAAPEWESWERRLYEWHFSENRYIERDIL